MTDVFQVLADPTRRRLVEALRSGERSVGELVAVVDIGQPGVSRQLSILEQARFVSMRPDVAFLDIQMPELDGFQVISALDDESMPAVVDSLGQKIPCRSSPNRLSKFSDARFAVSRVAPAY